VRSQSGQRDEPAGRGARRALAGALLALVAAAAAGAALTESDADRRARSTVRIFRALLAADTALAAKTEPDGSLLVLFFVVGDAERARALAELFLGDPGAGGGTIQGLPVRVELVSDPALAAYRERRPAALFLTEAPVKNDLDALVRAGVERAMVVASPIEGHVERGVHAGISIEAQVRPYLNSRTLEASKIRLKPFFLKVAKVAP
jgi:hypothetical protein